MARYSVDEFVEATAQKDTSVAWSGALTPEITTDVSLKTFFGRGSGESVQLEFNGHGWVVLQPYEEGYAQRTQ